MRRTSLLGIVVLLVCWLLNWTRPASADVILDWHAHAMTAGANAFELPIVQVAVYDAVNAVAGYLFESYGPKPSVTEPASPEAAAIAAAHAVLVALRPAQQADLDTKYATSLAALPDGPEKDNGIAVGQQTAAAMLALRANDGRNATVPYTPGTEPGDWQPTPPGFLPAFAPHIALITPWLIESPAQFRAPKPLSLKSNRWAKEYNEVKEAGSASSTTRTAEQTDNARFYTDNTVVMWNRTWRSISTAQHLSLLENARYFAWLTTAMADAFIACWESKYFYGFWRPVTAIRAGDTDLRDDTEADPAWTPLLITPNFPEHPSGHSCLSGSATKTLAYFFGKDKVAYAITSTVPGLTNSTHSFDRFSAMLKEVGDARVYGGIHYRKAITDGVAIGRNVARFTKNHFFRRARR